MIVKFASAHKRYSVQTSQSLFSFKVPKMTDFILLFQRPDSDERYRRLQSDKEALALQVQVLSEQVSLQNEKIVEMERLINEKNRLISNAEDLLQRVSLDKLSMWSLYLSFLLTF